MEAANWCFGFVVYFLFTEPALLQRVALPGIFNMAGRTSSLDFLPVAQACARGACSYKRPALREFNKSWTYVFLVYRTG